MSENYDPCSECTKIDCSDCIYSDEHKEDVQALQAQADALGVESLTEEEQFRAGFY